MSSACGMGMEFRNSDDEYCVCVGRTIPGGCEVEECPGPAECPYVKDFREDDDTKIIFHTKAKLDLS